MKEERASHTPNPDQTNKQKNNKKIMLMNIETNILVETGAKVLYLSAMAPETMVVAVVANDN